MTQGNRRKVLVHLIRHGQSAANAHGNLIGGVDAELTDVGRQQVAALNRYLVANPMYPSAVYCSTMPRARQTLEGLHEGLRLGTDDRVTYDDRLREICRGDWDGKARDAVYGPEEQRRMQLLDFDHGAPGGECMAQVATRMHRWLHDAIHATEDAPTPAIAIVAISHGIAIKSLLHSLFEMRKATVWRIGIANTSVTSLRWVPNGDWELRHLNVTPHLPHTSW